MIRTHLHLGGMLGKLLVLVLNGLLLQTLEDGESDDLDSSADHAQETSRLHNKDWIKTSFRITAYMISHRSNQTKLAGYAYCYVLHTLGGTAAQLVERNS
jgi:hypothetical protein